ncbi:MAG: metallophosphoesterase family protein [Candidatus Riflebacteria bacterium]|nr:metallophosphoesterase family protein [Candidatus Riflebacteria bacterium]
MKYFLMSDIHSNLEALETVLKFQSAFNADMNIVLGDITGYGPDPTLCVQKVSALNNLKVVLGNHDKVVAGLAVPLHFNRNAIAAAYLNIRSIGKQEALWLSMLQECVNISNEIVMFHGYPDNVEEYILNPVSALPVFCQFRETPVKIGFYGHTHLPALFEFDEDTETVTDLEIKIKRTCQIDLSTKKKYLFNPGSVGQPRDGNPDACFAVVDVDFENNKAVFTVHRKPYPIAECQKKMTLASYPEPLITRLEFGF